MAHVNHAAAHQRQQQQQQQQLPTTTAEEDFASILDLDFSTLGTPAVTAPNSATATDPNAQDDGQSFFQYGDFIMDTDLDGLAGDDGMSGAQQQRQQQQQQPQAQQPHQMDFNAESMMQKHQAQQNVGNHHHRAMHNAYAFGHPGQQQTIIPPTPNSTEMRGEAARFDPSAAHEGMSFTPLMSPAVMPMEQHFQIPFSIPEQFFSPDASPAIEARDSNGYRYVYHPQNSDTGATTSPVALGFESSPAGGYPTSQPRKNSRKMSSSSRPSSRSVMQSPALKAQSRRKHPSSTNLLPEDTRKLIEELSKARNKPNAGGSASSSNHASPATHSSVSPEPLSELMPPPAVPRSATSSHSKSPFLQPQPNGTQSPVFTGHEPVTPATLMRLRRTPTSSASSTPTVTGGPILDRTDDIMEDIMLPEAADGSFVPNSVKNGPRLISSAAATTKSDSRRPSKLHIEMPSSGAPTPRPEGMDSPSIASTPRSEAPTPKLMGGRGGRKRSSVSGTPHISPAIMPKLSPNIQPLIKDGGRYMHICCARLF